MKKLLPLALLLFSLNLKSQINLSYSLLNLNRTYEALCMTHLSSSGDKYYRFDLASWSLIIYNLNFSVYKTIPVPSNLTAPRIYAVSEDLFDNNNSTVEFLINDFTNINGYSKPKVIVLNESGTILFQRDSCSINSLGLTMNDYHSNNAFIFKDANGVKMILTKIYPGTNLIVDQFVYSLPGQLTCQECIGGIATLIKNPTQPSPATDMSLKIFPNPSEESTTIEYTLPAGQTKAELIIYSSDGKEIKKLAVDDFMNKIVLKNPEFPGGSYLLKLLAKDGKAQTGRWLNVR